MNAETEMAGADGLGTELHPPEGCTGAVMYDPQGRPSIQHDAGTCPIHERAGTRGQRELRDLAAEIGYSDGSDDDEAGGVDALIDYKNALEDRYLALVDGGLPGIDPEPLEGYGIMQEVVSVILNREEITAEEINRFLRGDIGAEGLYDDHIGRAVDRCEETIREDLANDAPKS